MGKVWDSCQLFVKPDFTSSQFVHNINTFLSYLIFRRVSCVSQILQFKKGVEVMINVDKSRVVVYGDVATVMTEFTVLVNSLKVKHLEMGLTDEQTNTILTGTFFKGMSEDFEYEEKLMTEGGLTDDK